MDGGVETGRFRFIYRDSIPHKRLFVKSFFKKRKNIFSAICQNDPDLYGMAEIGYPSENRVRPPTDRFIARQANICYT